MLPAKIGFRTIAAGAVAALAGTSSAFALPQPWQMNFQPAVTPVMENIEQFHMLLLWIITAISLIVLGLLLWIMFRYNTRSNPTPSKTAHNTPLEVIWTVVPVIILVIIAIPSFKLLYYEADMPKPDVTIEAIGNKWYWTYEYPKDGKFRFDSYGLSTPDSNAAADLKHEPHILGVDNVVEVPVNKVIEVLTTGADVIHSWAVPQFGVKMDAVPGRINSTWFKATRIGTYYGQCSELCGTKHAYMPIEVKVVSQHDYEGWLAWAKKKYAAVDDGTRLAALAK